MAKEKEIAVKENAAAAALTKVNDIFAKMRKSDEFQKLSVQISNDTKTYGLAPRITMSKDDTSKEFKIDNGTIDEAEVLVGTIVTYTKQNEYRVNQNDTVPTCSSVGGENGTLYGKCATCQHAKFDAAANRKDCASSFRLLVSVLGAVDPDKIDKKGNIEEISRFKDFKKNPFEIKVPSKSIAAFKEYLKSLGKTKPKHYTIDGKLTTAEVLTVFSIGKEKAATGPVSVLQLETYGTLQDLMTDITAGKEESVSAEEFAEYIGRTFGYFENKDLKFEATEYREPVNFIPAKDTAPAAKPAKKEEVEEAVIVDKGVVIENDSEEATPF